MSQVLSVNVGAGADKPYAKVRLTGIDKRPADGPVAVRAPGPKRGVSGVAGDFIGDERHHGGDRQAVYAFQREDLDRWQGELGRDLPNGCFGENLTTVGIDLEQVLVGERWTVGDPADGEALELEVTDPRIPCRTFSGFLAERGWVKRFTADARPGTYLSVVRPGQVRAGDEVRRTFVPDHDVTIGLLFRATTTQRELLPRLLVARDYLDAETRSLVERRETFTLDDA
ncbi:MOSC domain-containing protein [Microlunatus spumicola]|uniref:MOSC domain-containing protein n=1 Tax=Microlunatus spumicola TaxID=81499 RepID=A0ABP6Y1U9_9ACTN